jgi:hypothetical protein
VEAFGDVSWVKFKQASNNKKRVKVAPLRNTTRNDGGIMDIVFHRHIRKVRARGGSRSVCVCVCVRVCGCVWVL